MNLEIKLNNNPNLVFTLPFSELNGNIYNSNPIILSQANCWAIDLNSLFQLKL